MLVSEIVEYIASDGWVWVADSHGQVYYGWAGFVPERVGALEVGTVSGDQNIAGVIDIYVREEIRPRHSSRASSSSTARRQECTSLVWSR